MKVALIPCGQTEWQTDGRLLGRVELPLSPQGLEQCAAWVRRLQGCGLECLLHAPDELASQTASLLARGLSVPTKAVDDLVEVDIGLWTGLTESQLKARFASAYRQLREAPLNVSFPGGESFGEAAERLLACIRKQVRRNGKVAVGVVVRPLSYALIRGALEQSEPAAFWETARAAAEPVLLDWLAPQRKPVAQGPAAQTDNQAPPGRER